MTIEERLETLEKELTRAKRRSRWLLAALGLGLGALALVWASAASVLKAEAQGAAPSGPCRYQLAISPGYYCGDDMYSTERLYMLNQTTGRLFKHVGRKDPATGELKVTWEIQNSPPGVATGSP